MIGRIVLNSAVFNQEVLYTKPAESFSYGNVAPSLKLNKRIKPRAVIKSQQPRTR